MLKCLINRQKATWIGKHCLRALRAVNAPTDMIDQLGGWSTLTVGSKYGDGFSLSTTCTMMESLDFFSFSQPLHRNIVR